MALTDGYIVFIVQAIDERLDNQDVHAGFPKLLGRVRILDDGQYKPSYAVNSQG
jgi:hypothetical protein